METKQIISHIKQDAESVDGWRIQSNEEHSNGVAELASRFAGEFGCAEWGRALGLLHDKGKEKKDFQNYIRKVSGYDLEAPAYGDKTHAYVGAVLAEEMYRTRKVLGNAIMGHHAGLYDYTDLKRKLNESTLPLEVNRNVEKCQLEPQNQLRKIDFHHFTRMLYSCLVDADFLDTEGFMSPEIAALRGSKATVNELAVKLNDYLGNLRANSIDTTVNRIRNSVQQVCAESSECSPGFYSLTVPTGGGKTISSLVWAVNHALKYGKKRIIIAIPYTSIIVQTAEVLRKIFGEENVLEHHSNFNPDRLKDGNLKEKMKLATENWDYPIVVTTNVQLFESMFSNKPSVCRKLHNICNSVLILDEVQTLPLGFLQPIVDSLKSFQRCFGVSVLFTTASLPALEGKYKGSGTASLEGIDKIQEIIPHDWSLHDKLRRVNLQFDSNASDYESVANRLTQHDRVLCVVNTRKDAKEIYSRLPQEELTLHLSRMMCPKHLSKTIASIKEALMRDDQKIIRVVSTQLIEAGVDIDFPVVYRQEAGLDSVLQAAGRCNREGKLDTCTAHVFKFNKPLPGGYISHAANALTTLLHIDGNADWFDPETMNKYFKQLYSRTPGFDKSETQIDLYKCDELSFETAAKKFRLIDDNGYSVIVNYEDSLSIVEELKQVGPNYRIMKALNQYSVLVRERDFKQLFQAGLIQEVLEGIYVLSDREQYDDKLGLVVKNHWLDEILIQ